MFVSGIMLPRERESRSANHEIVTRSDQCQGFATIRESILYQRAGKHAMTPLPRKDIMKMKKLNNGKILRQEKPIGTGVAAIVRQKMMNLNHAVLKKHVGVVVYNKLKC